MEKHLKPHQHYVDLYDRHTVEKCRRTERSFDEKDTLPPEGKKFSKEQLAKIKAGAKEWYLHFETGERYLNKAQTIREWMDADEKRDQLLESAQAPEGIRCLTCRNLVKPTFKTLFYVTDKPDRVLFMYDCQNNCVPRRSFFSDGEEWRVKPDLCPQCNTALDKKVDDNGKKMLTTHSCPKCGYTNTDEYVWTHKKDEGIDENFAKDRDRFCLTEEEGQKYYSEKINLEHLGKVMEELKEKDKAREEKLKENPNGFLLEGKGRNCAICFGGDRADGSWYDKWGIKCLTCQWAIDHNEISASLAKDEESFYSKYDLESAFNLKGPTLRKWIKDGIIKVRTVSSYGKGVHTELFLLKDNKGFLPPKKLVKGGSVKEQRDGKDWFTTRKWYELHDPHKHLKGYKIMEHMRVIPPEEMKAREEEEKRKWEEKRQKREARAAYKRKKR